MSGGRGKSLLVGPALLSDGARTTAYQARTVLVCADCGQDIDKGDLFSRRSRYTPGHFIGGGALMTPVCSVCRPVQVEGVDDG